MRHAKRRVNYPFPSRPRPSIPAENGCMQRRSGRDRIRASLPATRAPHRPPHRSRCASAPPRRRSAAHHRRGPATSPPVVAPPSTAPLGPRRCAPASRTQHLESGAEHVLDVLRLRAVEAPASHTPSAALPLRRWDTMCSPAFYFVSAPGSGKLQTHCYSDKLLVAKVEIKLNSCWSHQYVLWRISTGEPQNAYPSWRVCQSFQ